MRGRSFRTWTAIAVLTVWLVPAAAGAVEGADSERIDAWITQRMEVHGIPGAAVAVIENGETIHLRGYGDADPATGRPVTPDTPFLIGSASKPFTAAVVRQLVDEGRLALDDPVLPHLEDVVADPPTGFERVTVRHLLSHTSGLSMAVGVAGAVGIHDTADALDRRVVEVLQQPLEFEPGERFEYSNAGPVLLAAVVERVVGQPFDEVLRDRIFEPLGMSDTFASEAHPAASRLAVGHRLWFGRWRPARMPYDPAGVAMGYIGSSARDLASFLHAHLGDQERSPVPASAEQIADERVVPTGWDDPLEATHGLGWSVDHLAGHRVVSHAGSLGHFTTHLIMVPDADGLGIAVATNASAFVAAPHEGQYDLSIGLARLLLDLEPEPAGRSVLMAVVAPLMAWGLVVLMVGVVVRHLTRTLPRWRREARTLAGRRWIRRVLLPGLAYAVLGAGLLATVPLGVARHFAPDIGWAATVLAHLAVVWALAHTVVTTIALRTSRAGTSPSDGRSPAATHGAVGADEHAPA